MGTSGDRSQGSGARGQEPAASARRRLRWIHKFSVSAKRGARVKKVVHGFRAAGPADWPQTPVPFAVMKQRNFFVRRGGLDKSGPCVVELVWFSGWKSRLGMVALPSSNRSG